MGFTAWRSRSRGALLGGWQISLRVLFERLGLTYLKLGQFLAMRLDLLPAPVRQELDKLFENVQPVPFEQIRQLMETELQAPLGEVFRDFSPRPIAAASVAHVHAATTAAGLRVVVKVQRPGVERIFASDVRLMRRVARLIDFFELAGTISITEAVDQFALWTTRELDFIQEGPDRGPLADECARTRSDPDNPLGPLHAPGANHGLRGRLEHRRNLGRARAPRPAVHRGSPPGGLASPCLQPAGTGIHAPDFRRRFLPWRPAPGQYAGAAGWPGGLRRFRNLRRINAAPAHLPLRSYLVDLISGGADESFRSYVQLFTFAADSNYRGFRDDIIRVEREWYALAADPTVPHEERLAGKFSDRIFAVVRRYRVRMNMDLLLFWRVFIVLDAVAARLSSGFDLLSELNGFFRDTDPGAVDENPAAWIAPAEKFWRIPPCTVLPRPSWPCDPVRNGSCPYARRKTHRKRQHTQARLFD